MPDSTKDLKFKLRKAIEALEFYADKNNWNYNGMYNDRGELVAEGGLTPNWKDVYKNITNRDLEPHDSYMMYGGKLARIVLKELKDGN
jgi:hypothetical protein